MRQENRALHAQTDVASQAGQADNLIEKVKLVPRRNESGRVKDVVEEVLHHNARAETQQTQLG